MINKYYNELIHTAKNRKHFITQYDDGKRAGLHTRGNVLLGVSRFLTSLKPRFIDTLVMRLLF